MKEITSASDSFLIDLGKQFKEGIYVNVNMHVELFDEKGNLKHEQYVHNTVTTNGKAGLINQAASAPSLSKIAAMAVGTGTPGANALGAEIARVAYTTSTSATNVLTVVATFGAGVGTGTLSEAGMFDIVTATSGNMWTSATIAVTKASGDSLTITWTLSVN